MVPIIIPPSGPNEGRARLIAQQKTVEEIDAAHRETNKRLWRIMGKMVLTMPVWGLVGFIATRYFPHSTIGLLISMLPAVGYAFMLLAITTAWNQSDETYALARDLRLAADAERAKETPREADPSRVDT